MNFNQLKTGIQGIAAIFGFSILLAACNNSDESANNSTTATGDKVGDTTTATISSDAANKAMKKRAGKVTTAAMTSDDPSMKIEKDKMGIYARTEVAPAYMGGQSSLEDYIVNNLQYPQDAIDNNVEGIVKVQFAVDENGNVSNVSTIGNKLGYGLEEEAIKVVSSMPKWAPGQVKGKNVKTWRTLPINYQLES